MSNMDTGKWHVWSSHFCYLDDTFENFDFAQSHRRSEDCQNLNENSQSVQDLPVAVNRNQALVGSSTSIGKSNLIVLTSNASEQLSSC